MSMSDSVSFSVSGTLKLGRTDAAGVLYFAQALELTHEAIEAFLESRGAGMAKLLSTGPSLPIVHTEANFKSPLRTGDTYTVFVDSVEISRRSITFHSRILGPANRLVADVTLIHACLDTASGKGIAVPNWLKTALRPA